MIRLLTFLVTLLAVFSSCASKQEKTDGKKPDEIITDTSVISGTVISADHATRMVTIKDRAGTYATFRIDREVKTLSGIQKGDRAVATYIESIGIRVADPGKPGPRIGDKGTLTINVGLKGDKPYMVTTRVIELKAVVDSINCRKRHVSVRGSKGSILSFKVGKNIKGIENVRKGDEVVIYYTEPVAILIEKTK